MTRSALQSQKWLGRAERMSEWVSSFLTAHQHKIGHSVPYMVEAERMGLSSMQNLEKQKWTCIRNLWQMSRSHKLAGWCVLHTLGRLFALAFTTHHSRNSLNWHNQQPSTITRKTTAIITMWPYTDNVHITAILQSAAIKNTPDNFDCNLNENYQIVIIFNANIPTNHQMTIQFPTSPNICFCTTRRKQNQRNITFLSKVVLTLNQNNAQKHILFAFLTLWLTSHPVVHFYV